ncbi:MAG: coenzyme F420-0:L-glutamate ligase / coenzyme F420:gamma-L-glutamate ligase, partial [Chloroflexota bacterium]|nr:coenzyme F420-0:L-glutamate ligase / coenzyme F420:gamma-L-glutamate ligase [Chloroflexota bacterium]
MGALAIHAVRGIPELRPGDDLAALVLAALDRSGLELRPWDVLVVTHKVVSKAEGALVDLATVIPSATAVALAERTGGDPRLTEVVLGETRRVLRAGPGVLVCETLTGLVCAN